MSCLKCDAIQELRGDGCEPRAYVRVDNANVELVGCVDHITRLVEERRRQPAAHIYRESDLADRAQAALDVIEQSGPVGQHEAFLALQFTRSLFVTSSYLTELEELAANRRAGAGLDSDALEADEPADVIGLLPLEVLDGLPIEPMPGEEEPPDVEEPAADCLNCDGSGCSDCRPGPDVIEFRGFGGDGS